MSEFLIKLFIKKEENPAVVREQYGVLAGGVGIFCNLLLFVTKLLIGIVTGSISISADAINNLSDGLSSVISIVGFKVSSKAPDEKHPFGYGRTEYIAGLAVSFLILFVGIEFLKSTVERILHPEPVRFSWVLLGVLAVSMLVKLWMGLFQRKLGQRIQSTVLMAAMQDSINDVITTGVVVLGMLASRFTSLPVDGYIGAAVAVFILISGVGIARETLSPLLGQAADPQLAQSIEELVLSRPGIVGAHDLMIHNYGAGKSLASIHAEVPDTSDFVAIHEVIDATERLVWKELGVFLVIHMDPISMNDKRICALRETVQETIQTLDSALSMHDFRVVDGQKQINLIFDVVAPYSYREAGIKQLEKDIILALKEKDERFFPVIRFDRKM